MGCSTSKESAAIATKEWDGKPPPPEDCAEPPPEADKTADVAAGLYGDPCNNILVLTDSYKVTHHVQYPPGTTTIYSYFESRGGEFKATCFFGLQYFLKKYMCGNVVNTDKIAEAEQIFSNHFGKECPVFNKEGWEYIRDKKNGRLPVRIKAVPEGTVVPVKNVLMTIENTDPKCFWLTNYLETLLVQVWYPTTVCTQSREQKMIIRKYLEETGTPEENTGPGHMFKLHDFGFRGVSSVESAAVGGVAHLVNFMGTDTMAALMMAKEYYNEPCAGYSIPASEHSTITSWGKDKELDAFRNMLEKYPKGLVACVSDSFDIYNACENLWGTQLKEMIEKREADATGAPGRLVVRPDSGELPKIVLDVLEKLGSKFGTSETPTKHKLLPPCIRVIQGDGIDIKSLEAILKAMKDKGWAADNLAFGSGGALLQKLHRDTQKCAFKCSLAIINGESVNVQKDPITDPGKKSKAGRLTLEKDGDTWKTVEEGKGSEENDKLVVVFEDGALKVDDKLASIRKRSMGEDVPVRVVGKKCPMALVDGAEELVKDFVPKSLWKPMQALKDKAKKLEAKVDAKVGQLESKVVDAVEMVMGTDDPLANIIVLTDSYKVTHHLQYPPDTKTIYSYFECRGGLYEEVCFFGLQYFLKKYMVGEVVTEAKINEAEGFFKQHFASAPFNRDGWTYIKEKKGGKLPVSVRAVPEGSVLPYRNVLFTLVNTDDKCFWLTNYLESILVQVWYPTTVCTQSREQKKIITNYMLKTGCKEQVDGGGHLFKLHDFGFRGVSSVESAAIGGAAHLVNFRGSDTMAALLLAKDAYGCECAGYSIPASEHSTMTSWGRDKEVDAMRNMLEKYPKGLVACVSDSYDIYNACEKYWGTELKEMVEKREGTLVVRPDSGELPKIVIDVLEKLGSKFTCEKTSTGHKLLPKCIRVIQGDGIDIKSLDMILKAMADKGWAADNLAFGSGGALLQKLHRDTQKCAFKCSYAMVGDKPTDVFKDPITDKGKRSKKGKLTLQRLKVSGEWVTVTEGRGEEKLDHLVEVFRDGVLLVDRKWESIQKRADMKVNELPPITQEAAAAAKTV